MVFFFSFVIFHRNTIIVNRTEAILSVYTDYKKTVANATDDDGL